MTFYIRYRARFLGLRLLAVFSGFKNTKRISTLGELEVDFYLSVCCSDIFEAALECYEAVDFLK